MAQYQHVGLVLVDDCSATVRQCCHVCCADARLQKLRWTQDRSHSDLPRHSQAAELLKRLLHPPPTDPDTPPPTPAPGLWESSSGQRGRKRRPQQFFCNIDYTPHEALLEEALHTRTSGGKPGTPFLDVSTDSSAVALRSLRHVLPVLPYNLVGGYLTDMGLDVTSLMRCANLATVHAHVYHPASMKHAPDTCQAYRARVFMYC